MKTLSLNRIGRYYRNPVIVDFDKHDINPIGSSRVSIDDVYFAPEDLEVRYKDDKGKTCVLKADKGDIIVVFYPESFIKNQVVVVKNKDWKENVLNYMKEKEAEKTKNLIDAQYSSCDNRCECARCEC